MAAANQLPVVDTSRILLFPKRMGQVALHHVNFRVLVPQNWGWYPLV